MSLQLKLRSSNQTTTGRNLPIDASALLPERVIGCELDTVRRINLLCGNRAVEVGDLFEVSGSTADEKITITGTVEALNSVGAKMASGEIHVFGNVGRQLGQEMRGGAIRVEGNVGNGAGTAMRGGLIHIRGDAGDHLGGPMPGEKFGMNRGCILVDGNAGNRVGKAMRRGLISVAGNVGAFAAQEMRAGTLIVGGHVVSPVALKMVRGTVILTRGDLGFEPPSTFFANDVQSPLIVPMIERWIEKMDAAHANRIFANCKRPLAALLYSGDHLESGRGELFVFSGAEGDTP